MNRETPNLQPVKPENKLNLPEKTASELEGENFKDYVTAALYKKFEIALAELVESGKINIELERRKAIETGNLAEKTKGEDFDVSAHMQMRAEMLADEIIEKKITYLQ